MTLIAQMEKLRPRDEVTCPETLMKPVAALGAEPRHADNYAWALAIRLLGHVAKNQTL